MNIIDDDGYGQYVDLSTNFKTNIRVPITGNKDRTSKEYNSSVIVKYFKILSRPEVVQLCLFPIIIVVALYILYLVYSSDE